MSHYRHFHIIIFVDKGSRFAFLIGLMSLDQVHSSYLKVRNIIGPSWTGKSEICMWWTPIVYVNTNVTHFWGRWDTAESTCTILSRAKWTCGETQKNNNWDGTKIDGAILWTVGRTQFVMPILTKSWFWVIDWSKLPKMSNFMRMSSHIEKTLQYHYSRWTLCHTGLLKMKTCHQRQPIQSVRWRSSTL